jgi:hypothetical protein
LAASTISPWREPSAVKGQERAFQAEAAEQDIAVDREQADKGGAPAERGPAPGAGQIPEPPPGQPQAERSAAILGDHGGDGDPGDPPAEAEHEQQIEADIDAIGRDQQRHRAARVLHAEQPAEQD